MNSSIDPDLFDDLQEVAPAKSLKNLPRSSRPARPPAYPRKPPTPVAVEISSQADDAASLNFTHQASRHEAVWIRDSLGEFYEQQWFNDILRLIKGGKEASVYLCRANPSVTADLIAAKVYRPRRFRNLKNDHMYREGRADLDSDGRLITDDGMLHAISSRSDFGRQLMHSSWIEYEYQALLRLRQAGADIPTPYARANNAILMGYIGDEDEAAPTLNTVRLNRTEARRLFERTLTNIEIMLDQNFIHGDLSAFNILYWQGEITLIDFPQAIHPDQNPNALRIFERDVTRMCEYFARQGVPSNPQRLAADLWRKRNRRFAPEVDPRYLDAEDPADRRYWENSLRRD